MILPVIVAVAASVAAAIFWSKARAARRADFIRTYMFPPGLLEKLAVHHPQLGVKERQIVARALRQFFLAHLQSGCKFVAMPSQVVDALWHEFILYTRHYEAFCKQAFGRYMHHSPAIVLGTRHDSNAGLRRVWWYCCKEENINPRKPTRLPLLFALDAKYNIANGFRYEANCQGVRRTDANSNDASGATYCGSDFGSSGYDGTSDGFGDSGSGSGSGADGGSDSGSGCGGGCGGGD